MSIPCNFCLFEGHSRHQEALEIIFNDQSLTREGCKEMNKLRKWGTFCVLTEDVRTTLTHGLTPYLCYTPLPPLLCALTCVCVCVPLGGKSRKQSWWTTARASCRLSSRPPSHTAGEVRPRFGTSSVCLVGENRRAPSRHCMDENL